VHLPEKLPIVLVHGGLYEDMTSQEFWNETGVAGELRARHLDFIAPQRPEHPRSWIEESNAVLRAIDDAGFERVALVAASNGCSAAVRMTLEHPSRVARLMLAWPATSGDAVIDEVLRVVITDSADASTASDLLAGETLRGVTDAELGSLTIPVVVYPSLIEDQAHQRSTLMGILAAVEGSFMVAGSPDPYSPDFPAHLEAFITIISEFARVEYDD